MTNIGKGGNPNSGTPSINSISKNELYLSDIPNNSNMTVTIPNPLRNQHPIVISNELYFVHFCNPYLATISVTARQLMTFMNRNLSITPSDVLPS